MKQKKDFDVKYEYLPSKQFEVRLQRGFEIIFEKIIKTEEYNQTNQKHLSVPDQ
jgi:hypothetical protein